MAIKGICLYFCFCFQLQKNDVSVLGTLDVYDELVKEMTTVELNSRMKENMEKNLELFLQLEEENSN